MKKKITIREFLLETGNFPNLTGFYPLCRAVEIVREKGHISITKELYPQLAGEFNSTAAKIERAMRHITADRITLKQYKDLWGLAKRPTVSEFIYNFALVGG